MTRARAPALLLREHRVQAVLRRQALDGRAAACRLTPQMPQRGVPREHVVGVDRLMRAMKRADAEVDDADRHARRIVTPGRATLRGT